MSQAIQIPITSGRPTKAHKMRITAYSRKAAPSVARLAREAIREDNEYLEIVRVHGSVIGRWTDAAEAALDRHSGAYRRLIDMLIAAPSSGLAGCRAKARALRTCPDNVALVESLLDDLEALS